MSYNQNTQRVKAMFKRKKKLDEDIIKTLISYPHCLDDEPEKDDVYNFAILYFEAKKQRVISSKDETQDVKGPAVLIETVLEQVKTDDKGLNKLLAKLVYSLSEEELRTVPSDIKEKAFETINNFLKEVSS